MKTVIGWMGSQIMVDDTQGGVSPQHMRVVVGEDGVMQAISPDEHSRLFAEEKTGGDTSKSSQ